MGLNGLVYLEVLDVEFVLWDGKGCEEFFVEYLYVFSLMFIVFVV